MARSYHVRGDERTKASLHKLSNFSLLTSAIMDQDSQYVRFQFPHATEYLIPAYFQFLAFLFVLPAAMSLPELEKGLGDYSTDTEKHDLSVLDGSLALPDFDDPNIDKHQAVLAVLGIQPPPFRPSLTHFLPEDDSPYPEVRSAVANTDDPHIPCNTIRAWVLGLIFGILLPV